MSLAKNVTGKLSYVKDDRAMRHIYGCYENFTDFLSTPRAVKSYPKVVMVCMFAGAGHTETQISRIRRTASARTRSVRPRPISSPFHSSQAEICASAERHQCTLGLRDERILRAAE